MSHKPEFGNLQYKGRFAALDSGLLLMLHEEKVAEDKCRKESIGDHTFHKSIERVLLVPFQAEI